MVLGIKATAGEGYSWRGGIAGAAVGDGESGDFAALDDGRGRGTCAGTAKHNLGRVGVIGTASIAGGEGHLDDDPILHGCDGIGDLDCAQFDRLWAGVGQQHRLQ